MMFLRFVIVLLCLGAPLSAPQSADARDDVVEDESVELPPPATTPPPQKDVEPLTDQISRQLRCPSCPGSAISDSPSDGAVAMRKRVRELVSQGYTEEQILEFYALRYGEWILLSPKAEGLNWILWTVPPIIATFGLGWFCLLVLRWKNEPDEVPLPSDVGDAPVDKYEARLLEELER